MNAPLLGAVLLQAVTAAWTLRVFCGLKRKSDIWRYYTYLQNAFSLLVSLIFVPAALLALLGVTDVPSWVRGLRYVSATGLCLASAVYFLLLRPGKHPQNAISDDDFRSGVHGRSTDRLLHIIAPAASVASFLLLERDIHLIDSLWTGLAALPSLAYLLMYGLLTALHLWKPPYVFSPPGSKPNPLLDGLTVAFFPAAYFVISFLLWNLR